MKRLGRWLFNLASSTRSRRWIRTVAVWSPSILFVLLIGYPYYSVRLSLILSGHPFAQVVPKSNLDVSQYVRMDNSRGIAIVFSCGEPIGWIRGSPLGFRRFFEFRGKPVFDDTGSHLIFDELLPFVWSCRGWLLLLQAGVLIPGMLSRWEQETREIRYIDQGLCPTCGYDLRATPARCPECGAVPEPPPSEAT